MDIDKLPWRDVILAPVLVFVLKMLWDVVYVKIPDEFESIRRTAGRHERAAEDRHAEHMDAMHELKATCEGRRQEEAAVKRRRRRRCRTHPKPTP